MLTSLNPDKDGPKILLISSPGNQSGYETAEKPNGFLVQSSLSKVYGPSTATQIFTSLPDTPFTDAPKSPLSLSNRMSRLPKVFKKAGKKGHLQVFDIVKDNHEAETFGLEDKLLKRCTGKRKDGSNCGVLISKSKDSDNCGHCDTCEFCSQEEGIFNSSYGFICLSCAHIISDMGSGLKGNKGQRMLHDYQVKRGVKGLSPTFTKNAESFGAETSFISRVIFLDTLFPSFTPRMSLIIMILLLQKSM